MWNHLYNWFYPQPKHGDEHALREQMDKLRDLISQIDNKCRSTLRKSATFDYWNRKYVEAVTEHMEFEWYFHPDNHDEDSFNEHRRIGWLI